MLAQATKPILVVEDDPGTARLQQRSLNRAGFSALLAVSPEEAIQCLREHDIGLMVLDYHLLQDQNGLELYAQMKEKGIDVPVIMVTGMSNESTVIKALRSGVRDFVTKTPDYLDYLPEAVKRVLREVETEQQLIESESQLAALIGSAQDAFITFGPDLLITLFNVAAEEMFQCKAEDAIGSSIHDLIPISSGLDHINIADSTQDFIERLRSCRYGRRKNSEMFPVEVSASQSQGTGKVLYTLAIRDVTERRIQEQEIVKQAALLDKANDAILVIDTDQRIEYWNQGASRLYGWTSEESLGKKMNELLSQSPGRTLEKAPSQVLREGEWSGELEQVACDGERLIVDSRWTLLDAPRNGSCSILVINSNITDKKRLEAEFLREQRSESLGCLAGGIAHDLNNVLTPILMSVELLKTAVPEELWTSLLAPLQTSAERGADMVRQILTFSRGVDSYEGELRVELVIQDLTKILEHTLPKSVEIEQNISTDLDSVNGDYTQLYQVLMNLCVNARDAMKEGGKLTLHAANEEIDDRQASHHPSAKPGMYVRITVEDTGVGIPSDILESIFDPFVSTKSSGQGTGLGLSTTMSIVKNHKGFLRVDSEVGNGSRFHVYLPAVGSGAPPGLERAPETLPHGHGEAILVIDDEASICEIIKATLEAHGYEVLTANEGTQAVALYAQHGESINVVLTDMMMPVMDGMTTIRVLNRMNPDVRIIAFTGMAPEGAHAEARELGAMAWIQKPFSASKLLSTIEEVLARPSSPPPSQQISPLSNGRLESELK